MDCNTFNLSEILAGDQVEVLTKDGDFIAVMGDEARDDKKLALIALESSATAYICLSKRLKEDPDIYRLAVANNGSMYNYVPVHLQSEVGLLASALRTCPLALDRIGVHGIMNFNFDRDTFLAAVYASQYSHVLYMKMIPVCKDMVLRFPDLLYPMYWENPEMANRIAKVLGIEDVGYKCVNLKGAK
jgi:hypothetical protein